MAGGGPREIARRRSADGTDDSASAPAWGGRSVAVAGGRSVASSSLATTTATEGQTVTIGGTQGRPRYDIMMNEPTRKDVIHELVRKVKDSPLTSVKEKLQTVQAVVKDKQLWISKATKLKGTDPKGVPVGPVVAQLINNVMPDTIDKRITGPELAPLILDIHKALKGYVSRAEGIITRSLKTGYDSLNDMVEYAIYLAREKEILKLDGHLPVLSRRERQRGYLVGGILPTTVANQICFACNHQSVDEPDSNKELGAKYHKALLEWEQKKQVALDTAKKASTKPPRANPRPKIQEPYRQCHCHQFHCNHPTEDLGMNCPIKCIDPSTGRRYVYLSGTCTCPYCKCRCFVAFGLNAPQAIHVRQQLDTHAVEEQERMEQQRSHSFFAFNMNESIKTTVESVAQQSKGSKHAPSSAQLQSLAASNAALTVAKNMDPSNHKAFVRKARADFGPPGTIVPLPVPVVHGGKVMRTVDTRSLSNNKSKHRANNNNLKTTGLEENSSKFPIQPYKDAAHLPPTAANANLRAAHTPDLTGLYGTDEDYQRVLADSAQSSLTDQSNDPQLIAGIQASLQHAAATIGGSTSSTAVDVGTPKTGVTINSINLIHSPVPLPETVTIDDTPVKSFPTFKQRVHDRALDRMLEWSSPGAQVVLKALGDKNNTVATDALAGLKRRRPEADSQEGYKLTKQLTGAFSFDNESDNEDKS